MVNRVFNIFCLVILKNDDDNNNKTGKVKKTKNKNKAKQKPVNYKIYTKTITKKVTEYKIFST